MLHVVYVNLLFCYISRNQEKKQRIQYILSQMKKRLQVGTCTVGTMYAANQGLQGYLYTCTDVD